MDTSRMLNHSIDKIDRNDDYPNALIEFVTLMNEKKLSLMTVNKLKALVKSIVDVDFKKALLTDKLCSDSFAPKMAAIEVLAPDLLDDSHIRNLLIKELKDNRYDEVRTLIINKLSACTNKYSEVVTIFCELLADKYESAQLKKTLISALSNKLDNPVIKKLIFSKIYDENSDIKIEVIKIFKDYIEEDNTIKLLLLKVNDHDDTVKAAALTILKYKLHDPRIKSIYLSMLKDGEKYSNIARSTIIDILSGHLDDKAIQNSMIEIFFEDNNSSIRDFVKDVLLKNLSETDLKILFNKKISSEVSKYDMQKNARQKLDSI